MSRMIPVHPAMWNQLRERLFALKRERDEARKLAETLLDYADDLSASTCGCHYKVELKHPCPAGLPWIEDRDERLDPRGVCQ